jgi:hypothetical protein
MKSHQDSALWTARLGLGYYWLKREAKNLDHRLAAAIGMGRGLTPLLGAVLTGSLAMLFSVVGGADDFHVAIVSGGLGCLGGGGILLLLLSGTRQQIEENYAQKLGEVVRLRRKNEAELAKRLAEKKAKEKRILAEEEKHERQEKEARAEAAARRRARERERRASYSGLVFVCYSCNSPTPVEETCRTVVTAGSSSWGGITIGQGGPYFTSGSTTYTREVEICPHCARELEREREEAAQAAAQVVLVLITVVLVIIGIAIIVAIADRWADNATTTSQPAADDHPGILAGSDGPHNAENLPGAANPEIEEPQPELEPNPKGEPPAPRPKIDTERERQAKEAAAKRLADQERAKAKVEKRRAAEEYKRSPEYMEKEAVRKLQIAKSFLSDAEALVKKGKNPDAERPAQIAVRRLEEIVQVYPMTAAANEARGILQRIREGKYFPRD